jgi:hypothetical protein
MLWVDVARARQTYTENHVARFVRSIQMAALSSINPQHATHYHIDTGILMGRFGLLLAAMAAVPIILVASGEKFDGVVFAALGGVFLLSLVVFLWAARQPRLSLSPEGVEFRSIGFKVFTSWDNIERIDSRVMYGEGRVEGFALRADGLDMGNFIRYGRFLSLGSYWAMQGYDHFIPISNIVTKDWRDRDFGQEVRHYAPRLFE